MTDNSKEYLRRFSQKERISAYEALKRIIPRDVVAGYEKISPDEILKVLDEMPQEIRTSSVGLEEQIENLSDFIDGSLAARQV